MKVRDPDSSKSRSSTTVRYGYDINHHVLGSREPFGRTLGQEFGHLCLGSQPAGFQSTEKKAIAEAFEKGDLALA
jgi:hypothetical protein